MSRKTFNSQLVLPVVLLCVIVFFPISQAGFTTTDDAMFAVFGYEFSLHLAEIQGRINHYPLAFLYAIPYWFDSPIYFQSIRIAFVLLTIGLFSLLVFHMIGSFHIAVLSIVLFLAFLQNTWDHDLITSYPVALQVPLQCLFLSLIFFKKFISKDKTVHGVLAAISYFFALLNEVSLLYFPVFMILQWQHFNAGTEFRLKKLVSGALPIMSAIGIYLVLYFGWRCLHPSTYGGTNLYFGDISKALFTIYQFSISSLPGYDYFFYSNWNPHAFFGFHAPFSILGFIDQIQVEWLLKAVSLFFAVIILLFFVANESLSKKKLIYCFYISASAIFIPNLLLGFTPKYQNWVFSVGVKGYWTTSYSFYATVLSIALLFATIVQFVRQRPLFRVSIVLFFALGVSFLSLITDYGNYFVAQRQRNSHIKFQVIDKFLKTPQFKAIPEKSTIYSPTLFRKPGIVGLRPDYWERYIERKTGRKIKVIHRILGDKITNVNHMFFLDFQQESFTENQFLVFGKMESASAIKNESPIGYKASIFSYSIYRRMSLLGFLVGCNPDINPNITVNGLPVKHSGTRMFAAEVTLNYARSDFPVISIESNALMYLDSFMMSYFSRSPELSPISVRFKKGWSKDEISHRWCIANTSETAFVNNCTMNEPGFIEFTLVSPKDRIVSIFFNSKLVHKSKLCQGEKYEVRLGHLMFNSGRNMLRFETATPPTIPKTKDNRTLFFSIKDLLYGFQ